jgi:6-phosphogluconolactonase (cycloisomerase 2 family)
MLATVDVSAQGTGPTFAYSFNNRAFGDNTISAFSVGKRGALTVVPGSPFLTGGKGRGSLYIASNRITTCAGRNLLYASNDFTNDISAFTIDPLTGSLAPVPGSPFPSGGDAGMGLSLATSPDDHFLFAANSGTGTISVFTISATGSLTAVPNSPFFSFGGLVSIKVSPDGKFLAAVIFEQIAMLSIGTDGSLTLAPGSPFSFSGFDSPSAVDINCSSNLLFCVVEALNQAKVEVFSITPNGMLTPKTSLSFLLEISGSIEPVLSPDGRFLFISGGSTSVLEVSGDGSLSGVRGSPFTSPFGTQGLSTDSSGRFLFATSTFGLTALRIKKRGALIAGPNSPVFIPGLESIAVAVYPRASCSGT